MSTYQQLIVQLNTFSELVVLKHHEADIVRVHEYRAALRLQSWFRGYRVRDKQRLLNNRALGLQRHWRGYLGRRQFRRVLQETVLAAQASFYRSQATLVQKTWRGYRSRLYLFDFAEWKSYLKFIAEQNTDLRAQCSWDGGRLDEEHRTVCSSEVRQQRALIKSHHMISTKNIPGVFNSPYNRDKAQIERALASIRCPVRPTHRVRSGRSAESTDTAPPRTAHVQGPFLPPVQLSQRLHKTACGSVLAAEPFGTAEMVLMERQRQARVHCVSDEPFRPPRWRVFPPVPSSVHAAVPYGRPPEFRTTDATRFVSPTDFRRVLRPVATFDGCL